MQFFPHRQKCFGLAAAVWLAFAPISVYKEFGRMVSVW